MNVMLFIFILGREMYNESIFYHFCGYKDSRFLKVKK